MHKNMEKAIDLYQNTKIPIREICEQCGMSSYSFYKYYKGERRGMWSNNSQMTPDKYTNLQKAILLYQNTEMPVEVICKECSINSTLFYRNYNGKKRGVGTNNRIHSFNIERMKEDSNAKYYWIGFIGADGNVFKNSLKIELNVKDEEHLHKFKNFIEAENKIRYRTNNHNSECVSISIHSKELIEYLAYYGIVPNKSFCFKMVNIPKEYHYHFIRGYLDGDGSIQMRPRANDKSQILFYIGSANKELIEQCESILQTGNKICSSKEGNHYRITSSAKTKTIELLNKIYTDATPDIYLERKYQIYNKALNEAIH